jgi:hypothetical protein
MGIRRGGARGFLIAAGFVSATLAAGCGGSASASDGGFSAMPRAASASIAAGLKMNVNLTEAIGGPSVVFTASGSFSPRTRSGSMLLSMQVPSSGGPPTPMRIVIANGTIYERLPSQLAIQIPGGKPWLSLQLSQLSTLNQLPGLNSFIRESLTFGNPQQYLAFLDAAAVAGSVKKVGDAEVNGLRTTQYQAAISIAKLPTTTPTADPQAARQLASVVARRFHASTVPVSVWIDRANLIRRLQTTLQGTVAGHVVSLSITENITHYGAQTMPTTPLATNTTDLLSLVEGLPPSGD